MPNFAPFRMILPLKRADSIRWLRHHIALISICLSVIFATLSSQSRAAEIVWGFEGTVTGVGDLNTPPGVVVGSRFAGTIRFDTDPDGSTDYDSIGAMRSYAWNRAAIGIQVSVGGFDFVTMGPSDGHVGMTVKDDGFLIPSMNYADSVFIGASSDWHRDPIPPGSVGGGSWYARRNVNLEFHDFDLSMISGVSLPEIPFDIRDAELATVTAGVPYGEGRIPATFRGIVDRLYVVPEPQSVLLLGVGLAAIAIWRAFSASNRSVLSTVPSEMHE